MLGFPRLSCAHTVARSEPGHHCAAHWHSDTVQSELQSQGSTIGSGGRRPATYRYERLLHDFTAVYLT